MFILLLIPLLFAKANLAMHVLLCPVVHVRGNLLGQHLL